MLLQHTAIFLRIFWYYYYTVLCPCEHSVARSQDADGETASRYGQQLRVGVY